jgi:hypothetical protein
VLIYGHVVFCKEGFDIGLLAYKDKAMGRVLEDLDADTIMKCSHILHRK